MFLVIATFSWPRTILVFFSVIDNPKCGGDLPFWGQQNEGILSPTTSKDVALHGALSLMCEWGCGD